MLSATTPSKGSRRSTRAGRYSGAGGGRSSRGSGGEASSWRPSDKAARKWIQVKRPPAPGARFLIPVWVPRDELTPEELVKYGKQETEEAPASNETGDAKMTTSDDEKEEENPELAPKEVVKETVVNVVATAESGSIGTEENKETPALNETGDTEMTAVDDMKEEEQCEQPSSDIAKETVVTVAVEESGSTEMETATKDTKVEPGQSEQLPKEADVEDEPTKVVVNQNSDVEMVTQLEAKVETTTDVKPVESATSKVDVAACAVTSESTNTEATKPAATMNPFDLLVNTASNAQAASIPASSAGVAMTDADTKNETQPPANVDVSEMNAEESAPKRRIAELSPLNMSRETSEGVPEVNLDSKALESVGEHEDERPHNPVADTLADPAAAPPSRPVSEPAKILLEGSAAPLIGNLVPHPRPVAVPAKDSPTSELPATAKAEDHFVHSGSETTPFHAPTGVTSKDLNEPKEVPSTGTPGASDERVSEPEQKRARLE